MIPVTKIGGLLLGAFDNDQMVGFVFAFPGFESGRRILHSDMLAVKREYRSHGIGHQLKLAQRTHPPLIQYDHLIHHLNRLTRISLWYS